MSIWGEGRLIGRGKTPGKVSMYVLTHYYFNCTSATRAWLPRKVACERETTHKQICKTYNEKQAKQKYTGLPLPDVSGEPAVG